MVKIIFGLHNAARAYGVGVEKIRGLINTRKIKPKKVPYGPHKSWAFDEHDQEIIRESTRMKD